jgi:hypothetical protein
MNISIGRLGMQRMDIVTTKFFYELMHIVPVQHE